MTDRVRVKVIRQGRPTSGKEGYMLARGENVAAFYLDGWGATGRIYPIATCSTTRIGEVDHVYPSMQIEDGESDEITEIAFPEYPGFDVHSVSGGKTMAICLVRRN